LVDARHGLKDVDHQILSLLDEAAVAYQIVLTKIDKLKQGALERVKSDVEQAIAQHPAAFPVVLATSSEKRLGLAELKASIVDAIA
ncbi:MAG: ribosome biogenesis GTP-binding protein YihA/YsxC, partial [Hyphomicrobiaceae bacterium]